MYRFTKIDDEEQIVGGVVYSPNEEDSDGDWTDAEEIWKALKTWMLDGHDLRINHKGHAANTDLVECFQAEGTGTVKGGEPVPDGAWFIAVRVGDDRVWKAIKDGAITGFSMAGRALTE